MLRRRFLMLIATLALAVPAAAARAQSPPAGVPKPALRTSADNPPQRSGHAEELLARQNEALLLFQRLSALAEIDVVRYTGPPPRVVKNPTAPGPGRRSPCGLRLPQIRTCEAGCPSGHSCSPCRGIA
jgi:hypothetical protein